MTATPTPEHPHFLAPGCFLEASSYQPAIHGGHVATVPLNVVRDTAGPRYPAPGTGPGPQGPGSSEAAPSGPWVAAPVT